MAILLMPRAALGFDDEPNDACKTAESVDRVFLGEGALSSTDTQDSFETPIVGPGTLALRLVNLSNGSDDFELELFDSSMASVGSASSSDGVVVLTEDTTAGESYCLAVTGSEGDYHLVGDFFADPPQITDVEDSGGATITSADIGDAITIEGTDFGPVADDVEVSIGGVYAEITSFSSTEIDVVVPQNAVNGDLYVLRADARSNAYAFSVGVSTLAATTGTAPDSGWLNTGLGPKIYINRSIVTFQPGADESTVSDALDDVLALDSNRASWTEVGFSPRRNVYQVEWTWVKTYSPDVSDTQELLEDLDDHADIAGVDPEFPVELYSSDALIGMPTDFDLLHDSGAHRGAFAQVGMEEARRLFRYSELDSMSSDPGVVLVDSGLRFGSATWDSGTVCNSSTGTGGMVDEFPATHFSLVEYDVDAWAATAAPGHYVGTGGTQIHGNTMAGVIGSRNQGDPDWADGAARSGINANGVLAGFDLHGVDDDGDEVVDLDDPGESIEYGVVVVNGFGEAGSSQRLSNKFLLDAYEEVASNTDYDGKVVVLANGYPFPDWATYGFWRRHNDVIRSLCRNRIVVTTAGQNAEEPVDIGAGLSCGGGASGNAVASDLACFCPERSIIVGGTEAGDNRAGTDTILDHPAIGEANVGEAISLLAPASAYTTATVCTGGGSPADGYFQGMVGTSPASALVGAATALVRGIVPGSTLSDEGVVQLIETSVDDVSSLYSETGAQTRLDIYEAVEGALALADGLPAHFLDRVRLYAVDYEGDLLVAQDIEDLEDGTFAGTSTVDTFYVSADGCYGPSDVEVHPLGDVVYVLCADSAMVAAYTAGDLEFVGSVELDGSVESYSELEITADGIVRVGTIDGDGDLTLESFDSFSGSKHLDAEEIYTANDVAASYGIRATSDGVELALVATDGDDGTDDHDVLALVQPEPLDKSGSTVTVDDLTATSLSYLARDVDWRADDSSAVSVLYGDGSGTDIELYESDWDSISNDATIVDCEDVTSIAMNPTDQDDMAYIACQDNHHVAVVDLASASADYTPDFFLYGSATPSTEDDYVPTIVEMAPNGRFAFMGLQFVGGGSGYSWVVTAGHDAVLGSKSSDLYLGSYDVMSVVEFDQPRGLDITPLLSIVSPRPGTTISGVRTLRVVIRDPAVVEVEFRRGPNSLCTDTSVLHGVAECQVDLSSWSSGQHIVTVVATTDAADEYFIKVPYDVP